MAWIESHQEIGRHPKTKKVARRLGVSIPTAVGHLHLLWHWAMDFAEDGELDAFEQWELADAAMWEGDPDEFVDALVAVGFIDRTDTGSALHDWNDYAGKLIQRRKEDAERKRKTRGTTDKTRKSDDDRSRSDGHPADVRTPSDVTVPNRTKPNPTGVSDDTPARARRAPDDEVHDRRFDLFWSVYPKKVGKGAARAWWKKRRPSQELTERMVAAIRVQSQSEQWIRDHGQYIPNPATWLNQDRWEDDLPPPARDPTNVTPFQGSSRRNADYPEGWTGSSHDFARLAQDLERQGR